jgi:carbon storage regulator
MRKRPFKVPVAAQGRLKLQLLGRELCMLVLRRKVGESIILAGVINISILAVEGERVKIGINAPPDVSIVREELLHTLQAEKSSYSDSIQGEHE